MGFGMGMVMGALSGAGQGLAQVGASQTDYLNKSDLMKQQEELETQRAITINQAQLEAQHQMENVREGENAAAYRGGAAPIATPVNAGLVQGAVQGPTQTAAPATPNPVQNAAATWSAPAGQTSATPPGATAGAPLVAAVAPPPAEAPAPQATAPAVSGVQNLMNAGKFSQAMQAAEAGTSGVGVTPWGGTVFNKNDPSTWPTGQDKTSYMQTIAGTRQQIADAYTTRAQAIKERADTYKERFKDLSVSALGVQQRNLASLGRTYADQVTQYNMLMATMPNPQTAANLQKAQEALIDVQAQQQALTQVLSTKAATPGLVPVTAGPKAVPGKARGYNPDGSLKTPSQLFGR